MKIKTLLMGAICLSIGTSALAADDFPLRAKYADIPVISVDELKASIGNIDVVDVRSKFEFDTIHVKDAKHISISTGGFVPVVKKLSESNGGKKIAFYCNGHTCSKSYKATKKALEAGISNVVAFDAGIFDWTKANPDMAVLLGEKADPSKLIPKSELKKRFVDTAGVSTKADAGALVIDIREPFQRKFVPEVAGMRNIPLNRLGTMLEAGQFKDKELVFIDAVGKQVRWLQYYLENHGYSNYSFLKGGVKSFQ